MTKKIVNIKTKQPEESFRYKAHRVFCKVCPRTKSGECSKAKKLQEENS